MSRSYKKVGLWKSSGHGHMKFAKREANKRVRHASYVEDGSYYKRLYCRYDIWDYIYGAYPGEIGGYFVEYLKERGEGYKLYRK